MGAQPEQPGRTGGNSGGINPFNGTPGTPFLSNVSSVASGDEHSCALKTDATVACWGQNSDGQLGRGAVGLPDPTPVTVPGLTGVVAITTGSFHSCAVKNDGTVACWGSNGAKQVSNGVALAIATPTAVAGITGALAIEAGAYFTCALIADGTVRCWGSNAVGGLGNPSVAVGTSTATPVVVDGLDRVTGVTAGFAHACARKTSGAVFCWGANDRGQLGNGGSGPTSSPEPVAGLTSGVTSVVAGYYHTCAVKATGIAVCWGANENGQLGNGTLTDSAVPVTVSNVTNATAIAPGSKHTCLVRSNQKVACFGDNEFGQVADGGSPTDSTTAKDVAGLTAINVAPAVTPPGGGGTTPTPGVLDQPYNSLAKPERLLETRAGATPTVDTAFYGAGALAGGSELQLTVAGRGTTPSTAATVFLNITAVSPSGNGYLTVYPCGQAVPNASSVNFARSVDIANAVISKVGTGGKVCIFTSTTTQLIVDISGFFPTTTSFSPLVNPVRLMETRAGATPTVDGTSSGIGARTAGTTYTLTVAGRGGVPTGTASAALNVTVDNARGDGYLTAYPCDQSPPNASNVNYVTGQTIPALVVAKLSAAGTVCLFTSATVDLLVDATGYFATAISYTPLANPARFLETRAGATPTVDLVSYGEGAVAAGRTYELVVGGRGGISRTASAVLLTIAVPGPQQAGYATVFPCGTAQPNSSNLNFKAGETIANTVAAGIGSGRKVCIFVSGTTEVLVDVAGTLA